MRKELRKTLQKRAEKRNKSNIQKSFNSDPRIKRVIYSFDSTGSHKYQINGK